MTSELQPAILCQQIRLRGFTGKALDSTEMGRLVPVVILLALHCSASADSIGMPHGLSSDIRLYLYAAIEAGPTIVPP